MLISRRSELTGKIHEMDLDVTMEQINEWQSPNSRKVQEVFPNLSPMEREFILTGATQEEWDDVFPPEEEEE